MRMITENDIDRYKKYLIEDEKSSSTIAKYLHDLREFSKWTGVRTFEKKDVLEYKGLLCEKYTPVSVNACLSSLNSFFSFMEWVELRVKNLKIQKQTFATSDKELTKEEYSRLLQAAKSKNNNRLFLLMQTICSTGIRVSEVKFVTTKAVKDGVAVIQSKGKCRQVFLPRQLCQMLKKFMSAHKIKSGSVFVTRTGKPLDRSNIWEEMKKLCRTANVSEKKVFPHNLRHLFARTYYNLQKDVVRLADILGHSNVNTTRIYTMESGEIYRKQIQRLELLCH